MIIQKEIILSPHSRGVHLITDEVLRIIPNVSGIVNVFIKHTSASLTINENADPSVREDFEIVRIKTDVLKSYLIIKIKSKAIGNKKFFYN